MQRKPKMPKYTSAQLAIKPGDAVKVTDDFGQVHDSVAESEPWQLGCPMYLINCRGFSGYSLERVQPA